MYVYLYIQLSVWCGVLQQPEKSLHRGSWIASGFGCILFGPKSLGLECLTLPRLCRQCPPSYWCPNLCLRLLRLLRSLLIRCTCASASLTFCTSCCDRWRRSIFQRLGSKLSYFSRSRSVSPEVLLHPNLGRLAWAPRQFGGPLALRPAA